MGLTHSQRIQLGAGIIGGAISAFGFFNYYNSPDLNGEASVLRRDAYNVENKEWVSPKVGINSALRSLEFVDSLDADVKNLDKIKEDISNLNEYIKQEKLEIDDSENLGKSEEVLEEIARRMYVVANTIDRDPIELGFPISVGLVSLILLGYGANTIIRKKE